MVKEFSDADAEQAFKMMDADSDGLVTLQEFTDFLKHFFGEDQIQGQLDKVKDVFDGMDENKDGKLSLQEVKGGYLKFE